MLRSVFRAASEQGFSGALEDVLPSRTRRKQLPLLPRIGELDSTERPSLVMLPPGSSAIAWVEPAHALRSETASRENQLGWKSPLV
jgi:hypothetical protein